MRDPYKTLGVRHDAGADEIKAAWRNMAKAVHPDHNRDDPTATARFAEVGRAYETLKDPKKRSRYDQVSTMAANAKGSGPTIMQQRQAAREAEERAKAARANAEKVMEELARANAQKAQKAANASAAAAAQAGPAAGAPRPGSSSAGSSTASDPAPEAAEDMVERIFGSKAASAQKAAAAAAKPAEHPQAEATVDTGTEESVAEPEPVLATGAMASIISRPPFGLLSSLVRRITGAAPPTQEKVPDIAAEAQVTLDDIIKANWIQLPLADGREVKFQAAAGMNDGDVVHLKGQGLKLQGMARGDLAVTVHLVPHERFTVKGYDLHTALPVTIENAVLGTETSVEGLRGGVNITIPPWSGSDHTIRVAGEGLPDDKGGKGDLIVELRLMLWEKPDHKMTDLMRSMKDGLFL